MYGYAAAGAVIVLLGLGLGYKDNQAMDYAKENAVLQADAAYAKGVAEEKDRQAIATAKLNTDHYEAQAFLQEKFNVEHAKNIELTIRATREASKNPLAFMDDLGRDIMYYDCLRTLGEGILAPGADKTCRTAVSKADPTTSGLPGTAISPSFREEWTDACDGRRQIGGLDENDEPYTHDVWLLEFLGFTLDMCEMTVAALTPDAARRIVTAFSAQVADIRALHVLTNSQADQISQLTTPIKD